MLKKLFLFLSRPQISDPPKLLDVKNSILLIVHIILLYLLVVIFTSLLFLPILMWLDLFPQVSKSIADAPLSFKLLVFIPICEEIAFRLPLKFSKYNLFMSFAAIQFIFFYHILNLVLLACITIFIILIPFWGVISNSFYSTMEKIWKKYFPFLYYGFSLSFGILHIFNFSNLKFIHFLLFPFIVSNQIVMGLLLGYVRVTFKNGLIFSILLHILINLPFILIAHL